MNITLKDVAITPEQRGVITELIYAFSRHIANGFSSNNKLPGKPGTTYNFFMNMSVTSEGAGADDLMVVRAHSTGGRSFNNGLRVHLQTLIAGALQVIGERRESAEEVEQLEADSVFLSGLNCDEVVRDLRGRYEEMAPLIKAGAYVRPVEPAPVETKEAASAKNDPWRRRFPHERYLKLGGGIDNNRE